MCWPSNKQSPPARKGTSSAEGTGRDAVARLDTASALSFFVPQHLPRLISGLEGKKTNRKEEEQAFARTGMGPATAPYRAGPQACLH